MFLTVCILCLSAAFFALRLLASAGLLPIRLVLLADRLGILSYEGRAAEEILGMPVHEVIIPTDAPGRTGEKRTIKYVVIHETGNADPGTDGKAHSVLLTLGRNGTASWHYTVDDAAVFHHIPDTEIAWHAGDRREPDGGNACGIGIELCVNSDGDFQKTFINGAKLTAFLLKTYELEIADVRQHFDFSGKDCPAVIRQTGRWDEFLSLVGQYMDELAE